MEESRRRITRLDKKLLAYSATAGASHVTAAITLINNSNLTFTGSAVGPSNLPLLSDSGSLGLLALGAAGVREMRRHRSAVE